MVPAFPVYLFDLDGTLMDSAADICGAQRDVLAREKILDRPPEAFFALERPEGFYEIRSFDAPEHRRSSFYHARLGVSRGVGLR